jgi:Piwi domain
MTVNIVNALKKYGGKNKGSLPDQIIVYRDGTGGPTFREKLLKTEIPQVIAAIQGYSNNYNPQILYILVDRIVTHRLFYQGNQELLNPGPGTVLDMALVENQGDRLFDFFLIPHKATVATA